MDFELTEPSTSEALEAYFKLRWQLLRAPWDRPLGSERDELEESSYHLLAKTAAGEIIGIGRLHFPEPGTAQIRYMATAEPYRRRGVGKAIVTRLEQVARNGGARMLKIDAREPAVPFYRALGYIVVADGHTLFDVIRHKKMQKTL